LPAIIEETGNPLEEVLFIGKNVLKKFYVEDETNQEIVSKKICNFNK